MRHAIGVGNGTDAITIALRALGVKPGDEVVVPSFTFYASAEAIVNAGARPVFCDVDPDTRNVTRRHRPRRADPAHAAIVAVDLFGLPAPIAELARARAAGARGRRPGGRRQPRRPPRRVARRRGHVLLLSVQEPRRASATAARSPPTTTRSPRLARALRFHGSRDKQTFEYVGYNSRLDELQAAILRVAAARARRLVRRPARRRPARTPQAGLGDHVTPPVVPDGAEPAWHLYVVTHPRADELIAGLRRARRRRRAAYYRTPLHRQAAMAPYAPPARSCRPPTSSAATTSRCR